MTGRKQTVLMPDWLRSAILSWSLSLLVFALLCLATYLAYSNSIDAPFYFDDHNVITSRDSTPIDEYTLAEVADMLSRHRRWVSALTLKLNRSLNGLDAPAFRVVNIAIHVVTGFLLYLVFQRTLSLAYAAWPILRCRYVAAAAALLWLVHPLHTQSVTYIVQRMNSLAALFFLLAVLLYIVGRRQSRLPARLAALTGCAVAGFLAFGSKETAATLPIFLLLYEWYFFRDANPMWLRKSLGWAFLALLSAAAMGFVYLGDSIEQALRTLRDSYYDYDFTVAERVLTELRVAVYYFSLIIYPNPARLHLDYDFTLSHSLLDPPTTLVSLLVIVAALVVAWITARRYRILSFSIVWFLGNLVIESSVIGLDLVFEHRTYLPSMFLFLTAVVALDSVPKRRFVSVAIVGGLVAVSIYWTQQRNFTWQDPVRFWADNVAKAPGAVRPKIELGYALHEKGRSDEAMVAYEQALALEPDNFLAHFNLGNLLADHNRHAEAVRAYLAAIKSAPRFYKAHYNLAYSLLQLGQLRLAERHYRRTIALRTTHSGAHFNLALTLARAGKDDEAIPYFEQALALEPGMYQASYELAKIYAKNSESEKAVDYLQRTLEIQPGYAEASYNLANLLGGLGRDTEAELQYRRTIELDESYYRAHYNLAALLIRHERVEEAIPLLRHAVELNPDLYQASFNLGKIYRDRGDTELAVEYLEQALRARPNYWQAIALLDEIKEAAGDEVEP